MAKKTIQILLNGNNIYPKSVPMQNIFDANGVDLETRLNNINNVSATYPEGITVATVNGVEIKVPYILGTLIINGTIIFDTVALMKTSNQSFDIGEIIETKGYYTINDGGLSKYIVVSTEDISDDATLIDLADGHKAQLMLPSSGIFNFRQFGAKNFELDLTIDNKVPLLKYLNFLEKLGQIFTLFIPGGLWCFSETTINKECCIIGENSQSSLLPGKTTIAPISGSTLDFLWKCSGLNIKLENLLFMRQRYGAGSMVQMGGSYSGSYSTPVCPKTLVLENLEDSYLDGIYFSFASNCLDISNTKNTYIGYLNIRQSGGSIDGVRSVIRIGDNVEGLYIDYLNAEVISGNVFYGYGTDTEAKTLFILNDLQMEGTHASTSNNVSDPGYAHNIGHWFMFAGKLGSKDNPCIIHSASISNLKSYHLYDGITYKSMALFGHETNVPMGFIVGNVFINNTKTTGPWYIYDTVPGASFIFNQPVKSEDSVFYLQESSMPLILSINKKSNIVQASLAMASKVSYKDGALSAHSIVGTNDIDQYYTLYSLSGKGLKIRFYNEEGISSFTAYMSKEVEGTWITEVPITVNCSGEVGWEIVTTQSLGFDFPTKIKLRGLPKFIDYYEDL